MGSSQAGDHTTYEAFVLTDGDTSIGMHHHVIPSRHLLVELMLGGIPVRRNIGIGHPKDNQNLITVSYVLPHRVGTRHMRSQHTHFTLLGIEFKRNMVGIQSTCAMRDQHSEGMVLDEVMQHVPARLFEMGRNVHISSPGIKHY